MASDLLTRLVPVLMAIPSADVQSPTEPSARIAAYGHELASRIANGKLGNNFASLRLPADPVADQRDAANLLIELQSDLNTVRGGPATDTRLAQLEEEAEDVFATIGATIDLVVGDTGLSRRTLDMVDRNRQRNRGAAFAQLAAIIDTIPEKFQATDPVGPTELAAQAREWSRKLLETRSTPIANSDEARVQDLRDRAFTLVDDLLDRVRAAAAFTFAKDRKRLRGFLERG